MDAIDVQRLDWTTLKSLYDKNLALLHEKLLSGADWQETEPLRHLVIQLEIAMDKTLRPANWLSCAPAAPENPE